MVSLANLGNKNDNDGTNMKKTNRASKFYGRRRKRHFHKTQKSRRHKCLRLIHVSMSNTVEQYHILP